MASLAPHLALDFVQVPLDLKCYQTLAFVGILPFCIAEQRSREFDLPRQLFASGRVREIESGHVHLGLCNAGRGARLLDL